MPRQSRMVNENLLYVSTCLYADWRHVCKYIIPWPTPKALMILMVIYASSSLSNLQPQSLMPILKQWCQISCTLLQPLALSVSKHFSVEFTSKHLYFLIQPLLRLSCLSLSIKHPHSHICHTIYKFRDCSYPRFHSASSYAYYLWFACHQPSFCSDILVIGILKSAISTQIPKPVSTIGISNWPEPLNCYLLPTLGWSYTVFRFIQKAYQPFMVVRDNIDNATKIGHL